MNMVQKQAEPARHRKLAMLFLLPALKTEDRRQALQRGRFANIVRRKRLNRMNRTEHG